MTDLPSHLQPIVDSLCNKGCTAVNELINDADAGGDKLMEAEGLQADECRLVIEELREIMRVYDD